MLILHIAVNKPLRGCFDYLPPIHLAHTSWLPGMRLLVPFGKKMIIGILLRVNHKSCIDIHKLKPIVAVLDEVPLIPPKLLDLCEWASRYYQHPLGEVILSSIPTLLRETTPNTLKKATTCFYRLSEPSMLHQLLESELKRLPKQAALLTLLAQHPDGLTLESIKSAGFKPALLKIIQKKGWISTRDTPTTPTDLNFSENSMDLECPNCQSKQTHVHPVQLNADQQNALQAINAHQGFKVFLLQGVTGSGKTEVYLQIIASQLKQNRQVLVLVPEIGLTPQTIARFVARFPGYPVIALHSKLTAKERMNHWLCARYHKAHVVIGTRSAIFTPFANLGIIVLDEEHDASFKQQSGFRYSARDLAILRGNLEQIPVILGTATPSLETLYNAQEKRFEQLYLSERAGNAKKPTFHLVDLRGQPLKEVLSNPLIKAMTDHLEQGNQVLLFLNRRGYAPVLLCHHCGWTASCQYCDAKLTLHQNPPCLMCHHCHQTYPVLTHCANCGNAPLISSGVGTERLEQVVQKHFPDIPLNRIDRDTIRHKGDLEKKLALVHQGKKQILLGTQMLAKGHHFPNVTLVGILNIDGGLYTTDFRGFEQMGQLIIQVSGRAGRAEKPGEVYIQTHQPNHPHLQTLLTQGYETFATQLLKERQNAGLPPYSALALLRAETSLPKSSLQFLERVRQLAQNDARSHDIHLLGPIPATMERKAGQFRALLLFQANNRSILQKWLSWFIIRLESQTWNRKVRWSIDVDPWDVF